MYDVVLGTWIPPIPLATAHGIGTFTVPWSLRLDPLSAVMLLVVTGIGSIIHVYATAYMKDEPRGAYARFFCYLNLFCFFMLVLVLAGNFLVMFAGWEGVGLCSYLLIGFWYEKTSAADAGKEGVPHQPDRRLGLPAWHVPRVLHVRHARFSRGGGRGRRHAARDRRVRRAVDRVPAALHGRGGEERADSAPCLAAGCDGRADARVRADPRRHDGDRRRLSRRPQRGPLRAGPARDADRGDRGRAHRADGRDDRPRAERHQARAGVLDRVPARLHVSRHRRRRVRGGRVPSGRPRVLQGAPVPRQRLRDPRRGRRAGHAAHGRR